MHRCGCSGGVGAAPLRFAQSVLDLFPPDWLPGGLGNSVDGAHELAATTGCHLGMESQRPGIKVIHKRCGPFNAAGGDATLLGCRPWRTISGISSPAVLPSSSGASAEAPESVLGMVRLV